LAHQQSNAGLYRGGERHDNHARYETGFVSRRDESPNLFASFPDTTDIAEKRSVLLRHALHKKVEVA